jgi:ribonuclease BN (tRNA processing enzyme)
LHRVAASALIECDELRIVFDFGRGVADRLADLGFGQDYIDHIVLSHFHPDHLSDLVPFLQAAHASRIDPRRHDLHLYGPPGLEARVRGILAAFALDEALAKEEFALHFHEVREGVFAIEGREFVFASLPPLENQGLKFECAGKICALTGDSDFHEQEIRFLRGVDLAVIDAGHPTDEEIVELAAATQVGRLVCSHLYRELDEAALAVQAAKLGFTGQLIVARDQMTFQI